MKIETITKMFAYIVAFTFLLAMIGLSLAIFYVPFGAQIGLLGLVWFLPSFLIFHVSTYIEKKGNGDKT